MNWLITCGCGFTGTNLLKHLPGEAGHRIRVLDDLSVGAREDLTGVTQFAELTPSSLRGECWNKNQAQLFIGDILDERLALRAVEGAEVIVYFAANTGVGPSVWDNLNLRRQEPG